MNFSAGLKGKKILVTRPKHQSKELIRKLKRLGASVIHIPLIEISAPPDDFKALDKCLQEVDLYDWIIFTSQNAVSIFFDRLSLKKLEFPKKLKIASVGDETSKILQRRGVKKIVVSQKKGSKGLVEALKRYNFRAKRVLYPCAKNAMAALPAWLERQGARLRKVKAYQTVMPSDIDKKRLKKIVEGPKVDMIFFYSPSAVKNFLIIVGTKAARDFSKDGVFYGAGPATCAAMKSRGIKCFEITRPD